MAPNQNELVLKINGTKVDIIDTGFNCSMRNKRTSKTESIVHKS